MAAKGLVLALVITGVVAFDLNCHMSRDRVGVLLDQQYSWVFEKCDRLIANIGNPDILGHLEADSTLMGKLQSARANNSNIKLFLAVEIYPLAVPLLAYKAYKDNIVQSVAGILMDRNLDGAVFDFDPKFEGTLAVDGVSKTRIYHLMNALKKSLGSQGKSIGLVAPLNGPLQLKSPADCRSLDQVFDFIELATQEILVNFEENLLSHRSALGPVAGNMSDYNLKTNIDHMVQSWLGKCDLLRPKTLLTVSPHGLGQEMKSSPFFGPLLEAGRNRPSYKYHEVCKLKSTQYEGWEAPVAILDKPRYQSQYWVSFDDKVSLKKKIAYARGQRLAGISFNSISDDDIDGKCDDGSLPLFRSVAEETNASPKASIAKSLTVDTSSASDKLNAFCHVAAKVCSF